MIFNERDRSCIYAINFDFTNSRENTDWPMNHGSQNKID